MKTRFSSIDVIAGCKELKKRIVGLKIINIYDIDSRAYLIKLSGNDDSVTLLIESGIRFHTTVYSWPKKTVPSSFAMKLRKHLRNRRVKDVKQFGIDRVICLVIGVGENTTYLIVELFDKGNIILCDHEYDIIGLLRRVWLPKQDTQVAVGNRFSTVFSHVVKLDRERNSFDQAMANVHDPSKTVKDFIFDNFYIGLSAINQLLRKDKLLLKVVQLLTEDDKTKVYGFVIQIVDYLSEIGSGECKGIVDVKKSEGVDSTLERYISFSPQTPSEQTLVDQVQFPTFLQAVDKFYSSVETQKEQAAANQKQKAANAKIENVVQDIERRNAELRAKQEECTLFGGLIGQHADLVEKALVVLRSALDNQLTWKEVQKLVDDAQFANDPVALIIDQLVLAKTAVVINLWDLDSESLKKVQVDIYESAYSNARKYYTLKKKMADKEKRTIEASENALKSARRKVAQLQRMGDKIKNIEMRRQYYWFEKFYWFVSSQNYLVIGGRDQHQNDLLVKKHVNPDDIYVHADVNDSASIVIKNDKGGRVPYKTLKEAAMMSLCYGSCWDKSVMTPAYWVFANQVSKLGPKGEILPTGKFMITGKRNFIQPEIMTAGFGLMFKIDKASVENHVNDNRFRVGVEEEANPIAPQDREDDEFKEDVMDKLDVGIATERFMIHGEIIKKPQKEKKQVAKKKRAEKREARKIRNVERQANIEAFRGDVSDKPVTNANSKKNKKKRKNDDYEERKAALGAQIAKPVKSSRRGGQSGKRSESTIGEDTKATQAENVAETQKQHIEEVVEVAGKTVKFDDECSPKCPMSICDKFANIKIENMDQMKDEKSTSAPWVKVIEAEGEENRFPENLDEHMPEMAYDDVEPDNGEIDETELKQSASSTQELEAGSLNELIEFPRSDDVILFCVPVCAPYSVFSNYKYKAKLQPGSMKRGKAGRTLIQSFLKSRNIPSSERTVIQAIKDAELCQNLPGKVKISGITVTLNKDPISTADRNEVKRDVVLTDKTDDMEK